MIRALVRAGLVLALLPWLGAARLGDVLPAPKVGYSATRVMTSAGQRFEQTVYAMPGFERVETETGGGRAIAVVDRNAGRWVSWLEGQGFFTEAASPKGFDPYGTEFERLEVDEVGAESIAGIATRKFRISAADAGGAPVDGHFWLTVENIMLRVEGEMTDPRRGAMPFTLQLENLVVGPQAAALFAPPAGLQPAPAMPSLIDAARRSGTPPAAAGAAEPPPDAAAIQRQLEEAQRQIQEMLKSLQPPQ
jgi:hypothetical protein